MKLDDHYKNPEQYVNVFYLDDDPVMAAKMHCDRSLRYAIVWTCQILSTVWHLKSDLVLNDWSVTSPFQYGELKCLVSDLGGQRIFNRRHIGHPDVIWAGLYGGNYDWLYRFGTALLEEFTLRFDRIHACLPVIRTLELMPPCLVETSDTWCDAPAVLPGEYVLEDSVESYKKYFQKGRVGVTTFTKRRPPPWLTNVTYREQV